MLTWLRERITLPRHLFDRRTARRDAAAGAVLGIESVPDGLASGLLAGVNPVAGLYGYLFGLAGGALFTGTAAMAIQGTGAMAIIVADVDLDAYDDPVRALATGLVVAVAAGSALAALLNALGSDTVALVADVAEVPGSLPLPVFPDLSATIDLLLPAAALAFVGLVQGAGVSAGFPNPDGTTRPSRDFIGQGAGNIASGLFRGVPVGGSMSATSLVVGAGARNRFALLVAAAVMAAVIVLFAGVVELVAMPALAGLLIVVGVSTVKPAKLIAVGKTGPVPLTVMLTTLVLTLLMPLQYAVLVGVGLSVLLFVIGQSSRLVTRRLVMGADDRVIETNPPRSLGEREVVVLQPYGPIFFATASSLRSQMPDLTPASRRSVVILRLRGADDAGATLLEVLGTYAAGLGDLGSRLVIVSDNERLVRQLQTDDTLGSAGSVYQGTAVIWEATREAYEDAVAWVAQDEESSDRERRSAGRTYRDPHEGDWPPDQMAL
ncbi:SulP family inorganic anion transporter [Nocardioides sp. NPDC087217]|uniref:SulP family inorganic anion transporter n=1 Tax=Nocardioides sp. NPDC087217 TaxID=3364335 RepID=UPI00380185F1